MYSKGVKKMNETKEKTPGGADSNHQNHYRHNRAKSQVTAETRREAYERRPADRKKMILECMGTGAMTSRQIALALGFGSDMNAVRPRITELLSEGKITVDGKALDQVTNRHVALYRAI